MGWKPLSLTAYLPKLERGIWEQTNNHIWKEKSSFFQLPEGFTTQLCERATHVLSWLLNRLKPIHSFPVHPLPPFAVIETIITACQCRTWQPGGIWLRRADRVKWLPLRTANQLRMRDGRGEDTVKGDGIVAGCCCSAGWHTRGCCTDIQHNCINCLK